MADIGYVDAHNKEMRLMAKSGIPGYLGRNRDAFARFKATTVVSDVHSFAKVHSSDADEGNV